MGMAASQARYLSLSARKTNTEYEGQQLNQQRLNIANQSADLFNQMLTMSVPTCPDSNDFTTLQYAWSDGINDEVISDFYQISVPNEDYNYVVTSYHYENVYTGQSKRMNAPEIQASKKNNFSDKPDKTYEVRQMAYHKESLPGAGDDSYTLVVDRNGVQSTHEFKRVDSTIDSVEEIDAITKRTSKATAGDKAHYTPGTRTGSGGSVVVTPASWEFDEDIQVQVRVPNPDYDDTQQMSPTNMPYKYITSTIKAGYDPTTGQPIAGGGKFSQIDFDDENQRAQIEQLLATYGDKYDPNKSYFCSTVKAPEEQTGTFTPTGGTAENVTFTVYQDSGTDPATTAYYYDGKFYSSTTATPANEYTPVGTMTVVASANDAVDASGNPIYAFICGDDMDAAAGSQGEISKVEVRAGDKTAYYTDGVSVLSGEELSAIDLTNSDPNAWLDDIYFHSVENDPLFSNFTAVGNCTLNDISLETYNSNEDMQIEIQQVIKDMKKNGNNVAYGNLSACFDSTTGEYLGGIYSFKMYGHTYYTTTADLQEAVKGAYAEDATATNGIDSQHKLSYYTSTYLSTKIEDTKKALMETDGKGRFSTVKFEDDDTVYTLKCETITDEKAYQDAMNQYFYKQEKYDKAVADINAKTELIQAEDRELQLRLEQLGTEQTALQTEMEACQKVVSKNIESSFKTFGG